MARLCAAGSPPAGAQAQWEFARRIDVPHETIRNWERGKPRPTGAARALLRVLEKAPETALRVLTERTGLLEPR